MGSVDRFFYSLTHLKQYEEHYQKVFKGIYEKLVWELLLWNKKKRTTTLGGSTWHRKSNGETREIQIKWIDFKLRMIKNRGEPFFFFPKDHKSSEESLVFRNEYQSNWASYLCGYCGGWLSDCEKRGNILDIPVLQKREIKRNHTKRQRDIKAATERVKHLEPDIKLLAGIKCSTITPDSAVFYSCKISPDDSWIVNFCSHMEIQNVGLDRIFEYDVNVIRFIRRMQELGNRVSGNTPLELLIPVVLRIRGDFEKSYPGVFSDDETSEDESSDSDYIGEEEEQTRKSKRRRLPPSVPILRIEDWL